MTGSNFITTSRKIRCMAFENIIGQNRIKRFFQTVWQNGRLSHAYLFVGPGGVGKEATAIELAKVLLHPAESTDVAPGDARVSKLTHPDVHIIFPAPASIKEDEQAAVLKSIVDDPYERLEPWANPSISIKVIRELRRKASYKSFEGRGRVVIMMDCERLTVEAANSLLKILEEPPDKMYLLMTSSRPSLLLPTITSRCQLMKFDPLSVEEIAAALTERRGVEGQRARLTAQMAGGSYRRSLELLDEDLSDRQEQSLTFFRKTIQSDFDQVCYINELLQKYQRDLKRIRELLTHLTTWFRDALIFREFEGVEANLLFHADQMGVLEKFTQSFPNADLHGAVHEIEWSLELMDRNVQIHLILIVLLNKLRAFVRR